MLIVTAIAAALLAFLHVRLSLKVIGFRRRLKVSIGDGGHEALQRAIRAQGNCAEYAPLGLILLACLELNQAPWWLVAVPAVAFVAGRVMHPMGIGSAEASFKPRVLGMHLTLWSLLFLGIANLLWAAWRMTAA